MSWKLLLKCLKRRTPHRKPLFPRDVTNAAIAGALLEAVHGIEAIPVQWADRVLTCRPIKGLQGVKKPRPEASWPVDALFLAERLLLAGIAG
jgi:hypothetical protein